MRKYIFISGMLFSEDDKDKDIFFINELKLLDKCDVIYFDVNKYKNLRYSEVCKIIIRLLKKKEKYIIIGHGKGGFFGLLLCKNNPSYFSNLILLNSCEITKDVINREIEQCDYYMRKNPDDKKIYQDLIKEITFEWSEIPYKFLDSIKIARITNIDIINSSHLFYIKDNNEDNYKEQIYRLQNIKEYNSLLEKNNKYFKEYFLIDSTYSLHFSDTEKILKIIFDFLGS